MYDLTLPFVLSQVAAAVATIFNLLSLQYKKREHTFLCMIASGGLMSAHYFLLGKIAAGVIVSLSILRFITCCFTTNKKFLFVFIVLNTISLFFTYKEPSDLIIYVGLIIMMVGNFQEDNKLMRKIIMGGSPLFVIYDLIIFSPMGVVMDVAGMVSGFFGYYRHYVKKI